MTAICAALVGIACCAGALGDDPRTPPPTPATPASAPAAVPASAPASAPPAAPPSSGDEPAAAVANDAPVWTPPLAIRRVRTGGIAAPLPEGVVLVRAVGELRPGALERSWVFEPEEPGGGPRRAILVLPSSALEDAAARLDGLGLAGRLKVEMTGTIFLYRGQNYLLPGLAVAVDPVRASAVETRRPAAAGDAAEPDDALDADADEIERRLRERLGPVPRSTDRPEVDALLDPSVAAIREGRVLNMRGALRRDDETGGWRFVPETAQASADEPSMGLLPCQLLQRLERVARVADTPRTLLLTGEVVRFRDRVFLLPTRIEVPRTGKSLRPGGLLTSHDGG